MRQRQKGTTTRNSEHAIRNTYYVTPGFGEKSDWFRNAQKTPQVTIQVGRHKMAVVAEQLPLEEAEGELLDYERRHPKALRNLARVLPIVAFRPARTARVNPAGSGE